MRYPWLVIVLAVLLLIGGALVLRGCHGRPPPEVQVDTLTDTVLVKERPHAPQSLPERLVRHEVIPQATVSRGSPDTLLVRRFAASVRTIDSLRRSYNHLRDSLGKAGESLPPPPVFHAILPPMGGSYNGSTLSLWLTKSDGSILRARAKLKPNFGFTSGIDKASETMPAFYEDRAWIRTIRQVKKCAPATGVMTGLGALVNSQDRVLGAVIGGGATLLGCLVG